MGAIFARGNPPQSQEPLFERFEAADLVHQVGLTDTFQATAYRVGCARTPGDDEVGIQCRDGLDADAADPADPRYRFSTMCGARAMIR